ncbi:TPA: hypothetical protein ACXDFY_005053 [Enterobacter roggenkampii]
MAVNKSKKYIVTIQNNNGTHQYTLYALDLAEAKEVATRRLINGQALVSVVLSKIQ